jgi:uroporphyrinogen decarboxylase
MTRRQLIKSIIAREPAPRTGFWIGNPHPEALPIYFRYFNVATQEELHQTLGDDFRWITPQYMETTYRHPKGNGIFDVYKTKKSLGDAGPFADVHELSQLDEYDWPQLDYLHFDECLAVLQSTGDYYRASGFWMPFFHDVMDLFGMEEYMAKMYTHPELIHAVTDRVCQFYYEANERFFKEAGDLVDGFFFGNDLGTQRDLLLAPEHLEEFVFSWMRQFTDQAHRFGKQVLLHSCGSVEKIIETFISMGIDCLHPLQARAFGMDAETLAAKYKNRISFFGGIDTQQLLVQGTQEQVRDEVRRIKKLLAPHVIISPSHEALLSNIPPENVRAMAETAHE